MRHPNYKNIVLEDGNEYRFVEVLEITDTYVKFVTDPMHMSNRKVRILKWVHIKEVVDS